MQLKFRMFRSRLSTWASLLEEAAEFGGRLGPRRLVSVSHSCTLNDGVVVVWYWDEDAYSPHGRETCDQGHAG